ncbi:P-loop containing nucleoside triphosphate hydrolase protein [Eremomyces bilateralis CBS 781.70]|uniref:ATP-dependent RNA helicase ROK1 n=1 Tax=Eremomyces bilateralis CBS 781.70 TaxID=1392243 RepID=A0A6G1G2F3_9PEZI|nr:P-loop containing nucleoside triphosphate hydrolase protein [Eremomyces bilateralis CBS 781.70]KAF1812234.1 P-loop containing nucleoside triphosphate hydrolase protein [Eremomyces bilateralis CBS 781.70]
MSPTLSRAVLRQRQFALRRIFSRHASTAEAAQAKTSEAASKASEGLSRAQASAGSALSKAGSAVGALGNAIGSIGGRTGRLVGFVNSLIPPTIHYSKVGLELGKLIFEGRKMSPPSMATFQTYFQSAFNSIRSTSAASGTANPRSALQQVRNLSTAELTAAGVVLAEVLGFFSIGEMIGRHSINPMDVFKLLTRSTKISRSQTARPSNAKLPSTGAPSNPQLFGNGDDSQGKSNLGKRKRGGAAASEFAKNASEPGDRTSMSNGDTKIHTNGEETSGQVSGRPTGRQPQEECLRILRSHKVKIVVLDSEPKQSKESTGLKKSKKEKGSSKESGSGSKHKQELFPQPLVSFDQLRTQYNISRRLLSNIKDQGYVVPTEVQLASIPLLLDPAKSLANSDSFVDTDAPDLLSIAPTGSGKTLAFLIPILHRLISERKKSKSETEEHGLKAIVLAPTKELASQIANEGRKLALNTGIKVTLFRKGMKIGTSLERVGDEEQSDNESDVDDHEKRAALEIKSHVLVSTPLALLNSLSSDDGKERSLPTVQQLVLDEADVLLDPLFRDQTLGIWKKCTNSNLQSTLWSATISSSIEEIATNFWKDRRRPSKNDASSESKSLLLRLVVGIKDTAVPNIDHKLVYAATEQGKLLGLRQLIHPSAPQGEAGPSLRPPFLVFTQTIPRAVALHSELLFDIPPEAGGASRLAVLHSDLSEQARDRVMTRFRKGEIWVLITTDLLARGVDFRGVNGVVNYDIPNSAAAYVHRVGRTGRAGREGGVAVTYYTKEDIPYVKNIANVIAASERSRGDEKTTIEPWLLNALPTPSKRDKQLLKKRGVPARSVNALNGKGDGKGPAAARISTKSGFERRMENKRKAAKSHHQSDRNDAVVKHVLEENESEFEGFDD